MNRLVVKPGADGQIGAGDQHVDRRFLLDDRLDLRDDAAPPSQLHRQETGEASGNDSDCKNDKRAGFIRSVLGSASMLTPQNDQELV